MEKNIQSLEVVHCSVLFDVTKQFFCQHIQSINKKLDYFLAVFSSLGMLLLSALIFSSLSTTFNKQIRRQMLNICSKDNLPPQDVCPGTRAAPVMWNWKRKTILSSIILTSTGFPPVKLMAGTAFLISNHVWVFSVMEGSRRTSGGIFCTFEYYVCPVRFSNWLSSVGWGLTSASPSDIPTSQVP